MRRITNALILASAALIAAGGFIHLREWLETYRDVPSEAPGAFVVRVGFPVNAGLSFVLALALLTTVLVRGGSSSSRSPPRSDFRRARWPC